MALRAARRERGRRVLQQQQQKSQGQEVTVEGTSSSAAPRPNLFMSRWIWYVGVGLPTVLIGWAIQDENSPPAQFADMIGLKALIAGFANEISKPSHEKLLPDWSQVCVLLSQS